MDHTFTFFSSYHQPTLLNSTPQSSIHLLLLLLFTTTQQLPPLASYPFLKRFTSPAAAEEEEVRRVKTDWHTHTYISNGVGWEYDHPLLHLQAGRWVWRRWYRWRVWSSLFPSPQLVQAFHVHSESEFHLWRLWWRPRYYYCWWGGGCYLRPRLLPPRTTASRSNPCPATRHDYANVTLVHRNPWRWLYRRRGGRHILSQTAQTSPTRSWPLIRLRRGTRMLLASRNTPKAKADSGCCCSGPTVQL